MKGKLKTFATWLICGIIFIVVLSTILDNTNTKMTYVIMDRDAKERQVKKISGKKDQVVVISQGEII